MFSLLHEFLGRLYRLITWQSGFNFTPGLVYFGMGRISLWAELLGWVCAPTPFIRWRFGLEPGAYALGLCTYCFLPHQTSYEKKGKLLVLNTTNLKMIKKN